MSLTPLSHRLGAFWIVLLLPLPAVADSRVSLTASADPAYTQRKYGEGVPRTETYVVMQGRYFEGRTRDRSIERMPFRRVAEFFAPELAKQRYLPAPTLAQADLVIVVHWGTTLPVLTNREMTGETEPLTGTNMNGGNMINDALQSAADAALVPLLLLSDNRQTQLQLDRLEQVADSAGAEMTRSDNVALLGYGDHLSRMRKDLVTSGAEQSLRHDLNAERYFIILQAYELRVGVAGTQRPIWTMHLNVSSPGNNFRGAMNRMSAAAVSYVGRTTSEVRSVRPDVSEGRVDLAPLVILNEAR